MRGRGRGMAAAILLLVLAGAGAGGCTPTIRPPGPAVASPALTSDGFHTADGKLLPVRAWMPGEGRPRAVIIALHGFNDYSNFFTEPGRFLAERGIATYAYDQRGFGNALPRGYWPGVAALADDLRTLARLVRERHKGAPLYLLGESMGGAVVMVTLTGANAPEVDGAILAAPAVWGRSTMPAYQRWTLAIAANTLPWMTVTGRGLGIKPSDNRDMLLALGRDRWVIKETRIDALWGMANLMDAALAASPRFKAPALILYGKRDEIVPKNPTLLMFKHFPEAGRDRRRVAVYESGYHMLLRDLQAETVWTDIAAWIGDRNRPLPSGADRQTPEEALGRK